MSRIVIAEDEPLLREQLCEFVRAAWPEATVAAVAENGLQATRALEAHSPDAMFLDIHMPEASGLEVARHASGRCHVVFVTAYDQYAVAAFEAGAVDYVMKPLTIGRVTSAVERVRSRLRTAPADLAGVLDRLSRAPPRNGEYLRWINASQGNEIHVVGVEDVCYFQSDTKYTRVVTDESEWLIRKSIRELTAALDPSVFWQVHRAIIVNVDAIECVTRDLRGHVVLSLKGKRETLPVSQPFAHLFRQM